MGRLFIMSGRKCMGECGGSAGVNYKMYIANQKYKMIDNMVNVFLDITIDENCNPWILRNEKIIQQDYKSNKHKYKNLIKQKIKEVPCGIFLAFKNLNFKLKKRLYEINKKYQFTNEDVYIFHDIDIAYAFLQKYPFANTLLVYHQQGSLYYEYKSFHHINSIFLRKYLDKVMYFSVERIKYLGFPSQGAKESLIATSRTREQQIITKKEDNIFYNGFNNRDIKNISSSVVKEIIEYEYSSRNLKFISVSALNDAKGVDRIPAYLAEIKRKHKNIKWIIIGNGVNAPQIRELIDKYDLKNNVYWIKEHINHNDVLALFGITDFYIMFHRFSIFDFATIEAMSYGNIPILTYEGGNKEVVLDNNGLFINDFSNTDSFERLLALNLDELKDLNRKIHKNNFSELKFLEYYRDFLLEKFL